jgi:general secretion pathway protein A
MYNDFFGFREQPFNVTPDPRVFYASPSYQKIYNGLVHSIQEGKGLSVMTGDVGTGKTTILRRLMREFEGSVRFAYFTYTTLPFDDLLNFLCDDLGIPFYPGGQLQTLKALHEYLLSRHAQGQSAALLIDEAQNLQDAVLEEIRHLLNLTTESKTLLPVILVGQSELEKKLARPTVYQLKQRVALHCQLDRLKERDVGPFIAYRLRAAECTREDLFTPEAIQRIAFYAQGIPRLINILCDTALLLGYSLSEKTISAEMIEEVSQDLGLQQRSPVLPENFGPRLEEERAPPQVLRPVSQEEKLPQLQTPAAATKVATSKGNIPQQTAITKLGTSITKLSTNKGKAAPSRTSSRWFVLAGTGLAFALWSFTLLPVGERKDPLIPAIFSLGQNENGNVPEATDRGAETFIHNIHDTIPTRPNSDTEHSQPKEVVSIKKSPREDVLQVKEERVPRTMTASASAPIMIAGSQQEANIIIEQTEKKAPPSPKQPSSTLSNSVPSSRDSLLLEAASQGDVEQGEQLLSAGLTPDVGDESGWTALMMATLHGRAPMVELLLKKGANVNLQNATGGTALMMAAIQGQNEILQLLLDRGANVNVQDTKGWTALMYAARSGHTPTVQILLSSGAEVDVKNAEGQTALMYATARGHKETVRALQDGKAGGTLFN